VLELFAFRIGKAWLAKRGIHDIPGDNHTSTGYNGVDGSHGGHHIGGDGLQAGHHVNVTTDTTAGEATGKNGMIGNEEEALDSTSDFEKGFGDASEETPAAAQILGVAILEFGVVFHSVSRVYIHAVIIRCKLKLMVMYFRSSSVSLSLYPPLTSLLLCSSSSFSTVSICSQSSGTRLTHILSL
jgi:hypothetical protein